MNPPRLVETALAALAAGVAEATIRKWASRRKLTRYGRPGRALYDLDEVFILMRANADANAHRDASTPSGTGPDAGGMVVEDAA